MGPKYEHMGNFGIIGNREFIKCIYTFFKTQKLRNKPEIGRGDSPFIFHKLEAMSKGHLIRVHQEGHRQGHTSRDPEHTMNQNSVMIRVQHSFQVVDEIEEDAVDVLDFGILDVKCFILDPIREEVLAEVARTIDFG